MPWSIREQAGHFDVRVEAVNWPALLEAAVLALSQCLSVDHLERSAMRRMRKIPLPTGDEADVWRAWWRGLLALIHEERVMPRTAGVREGSTPSQTHAVLRCEPLESTACAIAAIDEANTVFEVTNGGYSGSTRLLKAPDQSSSSSPPA